MTASTTPTKVTSTELARNLSDILNRVHYRGERFIIIRNGEPVATIGPSGPVKASTLAELAERLRDVPVPHDGFWRCSGRSQGQSAQRKGRRVALVVDTSVIIALDQRGGTLDALRDASPFTAW